MTKYFLGCYHHFTVTSFHSDDFYITTLHICSKETAFCFFYGRNAVPPCTQYWIDLANAQWDRLAGSNTGRLFVAFDGPVCTDQISNCPLDRMY